MRIKKNILAILCVACSISLVSCSWFKKNDDSNTDAEISDSEDVIVTETRNENQISDDVEESKTSDQQQIKIVNENGIFGKWGTSDKKTIIDIVADEDSPEEIMGDSFTFVSEDKAMFNTFRLEADKIIVNGSDVHEYFIDNYQLHMYFDDTEYIFDRITDQEYEEIYNSLTSSNAEIVEELDIPQEEILDTSSIEGLWIDVNKRSMLKTEGSTCSFIAYKTTISGRYQMGDDEGYYPNLLIINDNLQFLTEFKDGHLFLTNFETGEEIEMEKIKMVLYTDYRNKIYYGKF